VASGLRSFQLPWVVCHGSSVICRPRPSSAVCCLFGRGVKCRRAKCIALVSHKLYRGRSTSWLRQHQWRVACSGSTRRHSPLSSAGCCWRLGRYQQYTVDVGTAGMTLGNFYGWYYSIPAMIVLAVLLVFVLAHAVLVARPALAAGYQQKADVASRQRRLRNALLLVSGAVLLHLWSVLKNLADVASSSGMVSPTERNVFLFGPPFAALEPALSVAALCAYGLGVAAWAGVVLSAI